MSAPTIPSMYFKLISAASTNAKLIKSSISYVSVIDVGNNSGTAIYVKLYDMTSAPTVGTSVPVHTFYVPPTTARNIAFPNCMEFVNGLAMAITGASTDADTTAIAAGVVVNIGYN